MRMEFRLRKHAIRCVDTVEVLVDGKLLCAIYPDGTSQKPVLKVVSKFPMTGRVEEPGSVPTLRTADGREPLAAQVEFDFQ